MSYRSLRSLCAKQSGVAGIALLTALMVVALVTTIAVKESWRSSLDLARFSHRWLGLQSKAYIEGAEALALMVIDEDTKSSGTVDSLDEDWAQVYEFPTDHGGLRLQLSDAQGRVNLNGLGKAFVRTGTGVGATIKPGFDKHQPEQKRFIRLLRAINLATEVDDELYIDQHDAEVILEAVKDWIDADNTVEDFNGAEADYYNQLEPPLTINNGPMASVSELLRIKGMTPILYQRLLPHIVALDISVGLNINTANLTVLRSINVGNNGEPLSLDDAQMLLSDIQSDVPETADDFKGMPNMSSLYGSTGSGANSAVNIDTSGLAFKSDYFILNGTLLVGDHVERSKSLISRSESNAKVIRRTDANF